MFRFKLTLFALAFALISLDVVMPQAALAACTPGSADTAGCITQGITNANGGQSGTLNFGTSLGFGTLQQAISTLVALLFVGSGLVAFFYILRGALLYVTSGDDTNKAGKSRTMMTNAVIGLFILGLVWIIWILVINLVPGVGQFFNITTPPAGGQPCPHNQTDC